MPAAAKTRDILVYTTRGKFMVEGIPANAKLTFGALQPGGKDSYGDRTKALRIYTTANNQLAVFTDVLSFRDLSLTVKEEKVTKRLKADSVAGPNGQFSEEQYEITREWEEVRA